MDGFREHLNRICQDGAEKNKACLMKIIRDNENTAFGKKHHFHRIKSVEEYKRQVPISHYEYFRSYAENMDQGKVNQLTSYPVICYAKSSGSVGNSKIIPVTGESLRKNIFLEDEFVEGYLANRKGKRLYLNTLRTNVGSTEDKYLIFTEYRTKCACEQGHYPENQMLGGYPLIFSRVPAEEMYVKVRLALCCENLLTIESTYLYDQLHFFDYLKKHWERILEDIQKNRLPEDRVIPEAWRQLLLTTGMPAERMTMLKREFTDTFANIAQRIWPNLCLSVGISNKAYSMEEQGLDYYLGNIPKYYFLYGASEAHMGVPMEVNSYAYLLLADNAYMEFLHWGENGREFSLAEYGELQEGEEYEILLTTFSGLYRYQLGDILKCVGHVGECPIVEFVKRTNLAINICGEKLSGYQLEEAVRRLAGNGYRMREYTFFVSMKELPAHYSAVAVAEEESVSHDRQAWSSHFDNALMSVNMDYEDVRKLKQVGSPEIVVVSSLEYACFMNYIMGDFKGNHKPHHVIRPSLYRKAEEWMESYKEGKVRE